MSIMKTLIKMPVVAIHQTVPTMPQQVEVGRADALKHLKEMQIMRRMQLECQGLYRNRKIRGFLHLYYGQESIAEGMDSALDKNDAYCGAYRIHCQAYKRGYSVKEIVAQMLGKGKGAATGGRGGSMHYYHKGNNFYGGNGIVGAQIPVAAGLAFAQKYKGEKSITVGAYGDGAANQGQIYQASNMAGLWKLPMIFLCENNKYGMGTSVERASFNPEFYTRGQRIPGIRFQGNNVFVVKQMFKWAKQYCLQHGPLFVQIQTYRYFGHSMSDPGTSYRTRDEIQNVRNSKDPIKLLQGLIVEHKLGTQQKYNKRLANKCERKSKRLKVCHCLKLVLFSSMCTQTTINILSEVYRTNPHTSGDVDRIFHLGRQLWTSGYLSRPMAQVYCLRVLILQNILYRDQALFRQSSFSFSIMRTLSTSSQGYLFQSPQNFFQSLLFIPSRPPLQIYWWESSSIISSRVSPS